MGGNKDRLDQIMCEYRYWQREWNSFVKSKRVPSSLSCFLRSSDFVGKIVSSAARVYCSILCAQHSWPTPLEKSTWIRTEYINNGGHTGTSGADSSEIPIGANSSLLGGVAARISQRCMYIFKLFPIESTACLSKFAKQVAQQLVVPAKGFRSASKDHNNLLNSDAMSWHKEVFTLQPLAIQ